VSDRSGPVRQAPFKVRAIAGAGGALLSTLLASTRFHITGEEHIASFRADGAPVVYVLWHGRLLPCTYARRGEGITTLISQHRDGEYIARIVERWGFYPVRGSSSRGAAAALRQMVRLVRGGSSLAITPDGPRGPREVMKPGALLVAQLSGAPVVPVAAGTDRAWWFGGWDRFLVPKPFARIHMRYGEPVWSPRDAAPTELDEYERDVEQRLRALTRAVDRA
jgi:lysophospholipid acyltransferase (LPLAT)-like uncharacterized protein